MCPCPLDTQHRDRDKFSELDVMGLCPGQWAGIALVGRDQEEGPESLHGRCDMS